MKRFYIFFHLRPLLLLLVIPWLLHWLDHAGLPVALRWFNLLGLAVIVLGLVWLLPAHWQLYRPSQWTSQTSAFDEPKALVTGGAYRYVRHPQLLGIYLTLFGEALLLQSWWIAGYALLIVLTSARVALGYEAQRLQGAFGESYASYAASTKRFVPGVF